jgi:hypothetical protein
LEATIVIDRLERGLSAVQTAFHAADEEAETGLAIPRRKSPVRMIKVVVYLSFSCPFPLFSSHAFLIFFLLANLQNQLRDCLGNGGIKWIEKD